MTHDFVLQHMHTWADPDLGGEVHSRVGRVGISGCTEGSGFRGGIGSETRKPRVGSRPRPRVPRHPDSVDPLRIAHLHRHRRPIWDSERREAELCAVIVGVVMCRVGVFFLIMAN